MKQGECPPHLLGPIISLDLGGSCKEARCAGLYQPIDCVPPFPATIDHGGKLGARAMEGRDRAADEPGGVFDGDVTD